MRANQTSVSCASSQMKDKLKYMDQHKANWPVLTTSIAKKWLHAWRPVFRTVASPRP